MLNLLQNCEKYTHSGEVRVLIKNSRKRENCIKINVQDTGMGIDPENLEKIRQQINDLLLYKKSQELLIRSHPKLGPDEQLIKSEGVIFLDQISEKRGIGLGFQISTLLVAALSPDIQTSIKIKSASSQGTTVRLYIQNHKKEVQGVEM